MWVPPGQKADHTKWRFDVAQKAFIPPGTPSKPKGIQVEMPLNYQGNEPTGFHMVASPAGTQAPLEHINYTPETGEVHGRGQAAPPHMLNYTLMPEDALGPGVGQGSSPAMGMGAGASVPTLGADSAPASFAGTPPLMNSPTMMGPSPTTNAAAPQWGGGGTTFDSRMGMGADDDVLGSDPLKPGTPPTGGGTVPPSNAGVPTTPAPAAPAAAPAAPPATGGVAAPGNGIPAPGYPQGIPKGTPQKEDGTYYKLNEPVAIHGDVGVIGYQIYQGVDTERKPVWRYDSGQTNASEKDRYQTFDNNDGTVTIVDFSKQPPAVTKGGMTDPGMAAKVANDAKKQQLENQKLQLEIDARNATTDSDRQTAVLKIQQLQLEIQKAQSDAAKAAIEAGMAGQPKVEPKPAKIIGKDREIFLLDPDTDMYEPTGQYEPSEPGDWEKYPDWKTMTNRILNKNTGQDFELGPMDPYKEYPPQKGSGGKWIQWDPGKQTFKTIYQEDPDFQTQWSGDELIAVDKNNPLGEPKVIWKKKPTQADDDAHTAAIDAHNKDRIEAEKTLLELTHPKPQMLGQGSMYLPPGLDVNIEDWDPYTKQTSQRHASGGAFDAATLKRIADIQAQMDSQTGGQQKTGAQPTTNPQPAPAAQTTQPDTTSQDTSSVGSQMAGDPYKPGWPGSDPRLSGKAQPPTQRTTAAGDIAHYDEQGNLTGIEYLNTAPPGYQEGQDEPQQDITEEYFDPETGKKNPLYGAGHMGAGLAAGGGGWAPRPAIGAPAVGPGFLGAGAEKEQQFYDAQGNPIPGKGVGAGADANAVLDKVRGIAGTTTTPRLPTGGHTPPVDIKLPDMPHGNQGEVKPPGPSINTGAPVDLPQETDKGADWVPWLKDLVTQKVNESLKELLGWPKLEHTEPTGGPPIGTEGGFDRPWLDLVNIHNPNEEPQVDFPSDEERPPNIKDLGHLMGEGGTGPEDWQEMQQEEGIEPGAGKKATPDAQQLLDEIRQEYGTTGVGQEAPGGMMPPSGGPSSSPGVPPQGPGGEQPPQWLLTLLRAHPELLQKAGLPALPTAGGAPPPPSPPSGGVGAPPLPSSPPAGGSPPTPPTAPTAGWKPSTPEPTAPISPGGPGAGGPPPVAPSPEGGPMTPPLPPEDVAGIGHRFGQPMDVGEPQHSGVDLQAPEGTPTTSPVDGFVLRVENNPEGLGTTVVIKGMDGSEHRLGHLKSTSAYAGQQVKMGQSLGSPVGDTGMTTGAHLHWGVRDGQGQPADPTQALGPMANMPPVPGTQMMGPPGGVGGQVQQGAPQMGGGAEDENLGNTQPYWAVNPDTPTRRGILGQLLGSRGGIPGGLPSWTRPMDALDITPGATGTGQENLPNYSLDMANWNQPWSGMSTGFSGGQEGGMGSMTSPATGGTMGDLRQHPRMMPWNITPGATGTGQEPMPPGAPQQPSIGEGMAQFIRPPQGKQQKQGAGQEKGKKRKGKGWKPKGRVGAGQTGYTADPSMPGYSADWTTNQATGLNRMRLGGGTGGQSSAFPDRLARDPLERLPRVNINPMEAFGAGQGQMPQAGGQDPSQGILQQMLQQEWQRMQMGAQQPQVGAGASSSQSYLNPMGIEGADQSQQQGWRRMQTGTMSDFTTPAGGQGAVPRPVVQQQPMQMPAGAQGGQRSFAQAGAMPMRQPGQGVQ